jgi:hypothetical protein
MSSVLITNTNIGLENLDTPTADFLYGGSQPEDNLGALHGSVNFSGSNFDLNIEPGQLVPGTCLYLCRRLFS